MNVHDAIDGFLVRVRDWYRTGGAMRKTLIVIGLIVALPIFVPLYVVYIALEAMVKILWTMLMPSKVKPAEAASIGAPMPAPEPVKHAPEAPKQPDEPKPGLMLDLMLAGDIEALKGALPKGDVKVYALDHVGEYSRGPIRVAVATVDGTIAAVAMQMAIPQQTQHLDIYTVEAATPDAIRRICDDTTAYGYGIHDPEPLDDGKSLADELMGHLDNAFGGKDYLLRMKKYLERGKVDFRYDYKHLSGETVYRSVNNFDRLNDTQVRCRYRYDGSLSEVMVEDRKYDPAQSLTNIKCQFVEITDPSALTALQVLVDLPDGLIEAASDDKPHAFNVIRKLFDDNAVAYKYSTWDGPAPSQTHRRTISEHLEGCAYHYTEGEVYVLVHTIGAKITAASISRSEGQGGREQSAGYVKTTAVSSDADSLARLCSAMHVSATDGDALADALAKGFTDEQDFAAFLTRHNIPHSTH